MLPFALSTELNPTSQRYLFYCSTILSHNFIFLSLCHVKFCVNYWVNRFLSGFVLSFLYCFDDVMIAGSIWFNLSEFGHFIGICITFFSSLTCGILEIKDFKLQWFLASFGFRACTISNHNFFFFNFELVFGGLFIEDKIVMVALNYFLMWKTESG